MSVGEEEVLGSGGARREGEASRPLMLREGRARVRVWVMYFLVGVSWGALALDSWFEGKVRGSKTEGKIGRGGYLVD